MTACPLLLTTLSSFVLLKSAEPPTPPSGSAEKLLNEKPKTLKELIFTMLSFAKNATVVIIFMVAGMGGGMLQVILTQLNQLMCSTNYEKSQSTFIAMINIVCGLYLLLFVAQRARKLKKVQAKKLVKSNKSKNFFREIAFLAVLNFFPVQKLIFGHF